MRLALRHGFVGLTLAVTLAACSSCSRGGGAGSTTADAMIEGGSPSDQDASTTDVASAPPDVAVHAVVDLPRSTNTRSLSATAFDPATRTLFALPDNRQNIVPLVASDDYSTFTVGTPIALTGRTDTAWDGEGLVLAADGTFTAVTVETTPTIERFDASGKRLDAVAVPSHYANQALNNKGLESLTLSPSGRFLFTANESALTSDGSAATNARGTTVRILRRELATSSDSEFAYRTEPLGAGGATGDMGVSELAALDDDKLLVLERGYQAGYGSTVRIFRVNLAGATRVDGVASLTAASTVVDKTLVVDIGTLPPGGVTNPGTQPNPILDNYEALAIGPTLADGRRLLFVTSDDNAKATQVARVLVLAIRPEALGVQP